MEPKLSEKKEKDVKVIATDKTENVSNTEKKPEQEKIIKPEIEDGIDTIDVVFLPLKDMIIFPFSLSPLVIEGEENVAIMEKLASSTRILALFPEIPEKTDHDIRVNLGDLGANIQFFEHNGKKYSKIGVLGRIVKLLRFPDGSVRILVRGMRRVKQLSLFEQSKPQMVKIIELPFEKDTGIETVAMAKNAITQFHEIISLSQFYPDDLRIAVLNVNDNYRLVDMITDTLNFRYEEKLAILSAPTVHARFQILTILLNKELEIIHLGTKIHLEVSNTLGKTQREYYLREQLKAIKKELGEDARSPELTALVERLKKRNLSQKVKEVVDKELDRLQTIPQISAEYNVSLTYLSWIADLPWNEYTEDAINIKKAGLILDEDHYDLEDVKDRIIDFLAVMQLKKNLDRKSPILCFVGPPGVGKTSLGQSIARAMNRKFVRMSLGGIRDEAEIRGHRRTYVGALPGRIIQGIKKAGSANPVFMLDEIDKIGSDFRGDPAAALLEVLDPAQNNSFNDHYLELDFDLSSVLFIATANITETIPAPLLDRMEMIHLPGYTAIEKIEIARKYLIPRQEKENGLPKNKINVSDETLKKLISEYTMEAGVRNLERTIATVCRKISRQIVEGKIKKNAKISIKPEELSKYLGPRKFFSDLVSAKVKAGVVTGMAWTNYGGAIMPVEVIKMSGKSELKLTGSLGNIMKESAEIAFSFIKSNASELGIKKEVFQKNDFHIHVPDGATPKDGPSAGITILVAIISLLKNQSVNPRLAMTGEINLQGKLTPVGGIREKVIAALAAGVEEIILPEKNKSSLEKVPQEIKDKIKFHFFSDIMDAAKFALKKRTN